VLLSRATLTGTSNPCIVVLKTVSFHQKLQNRPLLPSHPYSTSSLEYEVFRVGKFLN
jgi:hypothetical protein